MTCSADGESARFFDIPSRPRPSRRWRFRCKGNMSKGKRTDEVRERRDLVPAAVDLDTRVPVVSRRIKTKPHSGAGDLAKDRIEEGKTYCCAHFSFPPAWSKCECVVKRYSPSLTPSFSAAAWILGGSYGSTIAVVLVYGEGQGWRSDRQDCGKHGAGSVPDTHRLIDDEVHVVVALCDVDREQAKRWCKSCGGGSASGRIRHAYRPGSAQLTRQGTGTTRMLYLPVRHCQRRRCSRARVGT